MATGLIGVIDKKGEFKTVVCETNAYWSYTGMLLDCFYSDEKKAKDLCKLGSVELLGVRLSKEPIDAPKLIRDLPYRATHCFFTIDGKANGCKSIKQKDKVRVKRVRQGEEQAEPTLEDIQKLSNTYLWDSNSECWYANIDDKWLPLHEQLQKKIQSDYISAWDTLDSAQYMTRFARYKSSADKTTMKQLDEIQGEFERYIWKMIGTEEEETFDYENFLFSNRTLSDSIGKANTGKIVKTDMRQGLCVVEIGERTLDTTIKKVVKGVVDQTGFALNNPASLKNWKQFVE